MTELNQYISDNYDSLKQHLIKYCKHRGLVWDEDVYHLTLLKILEKGRLKDMTPEGILNYVFMAFKTNSLRELQYPYIARRVLTDNPPDLSDTDDLEERIERQALSDYKANKLLQIVEQNFDSDHYNAFRLKMMGDLTYKQLEQKTGLVRTRQLVKDVRDWLKENVDESELEKGFYQQD